MIYLDNAATTKPLPALDNLYAEYMERAWFNPSALYPPAVDTERKLTAARQFFCYSAQADNCLFTSGGTEAANTVIFHGWPKRGGKTLHFITTQYEHPCVYESFRKLEQDGHKVDYIHPEEDGRVHAKQVAALVKDDTALVSIMHVQNETGAINDIAAIAKAVKSKNGKTLFHSDGVQAYLRIPISLQQADVDYYTVSAHKLHGLKGTGAILYRKRAPLRPLLYGGGQEFSLRPGTENTYGILAFELAAKAYLENAETGYSHMERLQQVLRIHLEELGGIIITPKEHAAPHILNVAFPNMRGEVLLHLLEADNIYIATGSACSSKKRSFRVHESLGLDRTLAECVVRFSFHSGNTLEEIDIVTGKIKAALSRFQGFIRR